MPVVYWLMSTTRAITKDIKSERGWRVSIELTASGDGARVTHHKAEASIVDGAQDAAQAFTVSYDIAFALGSLGKGAGNWREPRVSVTFTDTERYAQSAALAPQVKEALEVFAQFNQ